MNVVIYLIDDIIFVYLLTNLKINNIIVKIIP